MAQITSGQILHEARERKGYDLMTVARRLRIRPDILQAIETSDIANMPPRGYTRNMVNAYARLLGLNPTEIVNMYLDEVYAFQVERARGSSTNYGFNMGRESRRQRDRSQTETGMPAVQSPDVDADPGYRSISAGTRNRPRRLYDDRTQFSRDDYGITREQTFRSGKSERDFSSHHSGYSSTNFNFLDEGASRQRSRSIHVGQTPMSYSASRVPAFFQSRAFLIAIAVVVVVIIVAVLVNVFGHHDEEVTEDVSQLPVSGITDTTGTDEEAEVAAQVVEVAPTSARVVYNVYAGEECYIETYTDGEFGSAMLVGPTEESLEVTGTWTITTWSPGTIHVTVNGEAVQLTEDEEYDYMASYTVDFQKILDEWKATHTSRADQRAAAVASAKSTQEEASSSSASATGGSADDEQAEGENGEEAGGAGE